MLGWVVSQGTVGQEVLEAPKTIKTISIDAGCISEWDDKYILLKKAHAPVTGLGDGRLGLKWKSPLFLF